MAGRRRHRRWVKNWNHQPSLRLLSFSRYRELALFHVGLYLLDLKLLYHDLKPSRLAFRLSFLQLKLVVKFAVFSPERFLFNLEVINFLLILLPYYLKLFQTNVSLPELHSFEARSAKILSDQFIPPIQHLKPSLFLHVFLNSLTPFEMVVIIVLIVVPCSLE